MYQNKESEQVILRKIKGIGGHRASEGKVNRVWIEEKKCVTDYSWCLGSYYCWKESAWRKGLGALERQGQRGGEQEEAGRVLRAQIFLLSHP